MQQYRTFGHAGGAACVLQHRDVIGCQLGLAKGLLTPYGQSVIEAHCLGQAKGRHHFLDVAHHVIDQAPLEQAQSVTHGRQNHMLHRGLCNALFEGGGKVLDDDNRLGSRVLELVLQFTGGVQRIDIDHHQTGPQNGRHCHRVLRHIGHHDRDAIAFAQAQRLQVSRQAQAFLVGLGKAQILAHEAVSSAICVFGKTLFEQAHQRDV